MTLEEFNRRFKIVPTSLLHMPRDRSGSDKPRGDCQDYCKSVKRILGVKFPKAIVVRCWSKPGLPRHAVLWIKGKGFIDSGNREWRKWPWPCVPIWPVGTPALIGAAVAGYWVGRIQGWW
jgi:hypothetical protein